PHPLFVVGIDLGGTKVAAGAVATDGSTQFPLRNELTRAEEGADAVSDRIARMVNEVIDDACKTSGATRKDFLGVGVGAPGPLDRKRGVVVVAPNLKWTDYPLAPKIAERVSLPVILDNDANCATLGEWWLGAGRGTRNMVGLTIGTGIGGGLILDGQLYHGASDVAGEIGHTTIETQGRHCACGNYGCLEAYASGPAIAERAREALVHDGASSLHKRVDGDLAKLTAQTVYEAADAGDPLALEVVRDTARFLGAGVANLLNVFNPEIVVLAGGVTAAGDNLFGPLRTEVKRRAFRPAWNATQIVPGELGSNAGVVGAVAMFVQASRST
ncbi:MAG TPA: ROK family glucokinase, partial [Gemmatimonadaceae bacterium]|nr:ROK family glucokinase [Gemmatimonadaceae bacterium]